ncbi:MAG TPA: hypothetical protein VGP72_21090 [Planctomycetota bacterium]|jgi:hypothetical protein
MRLLNTESLAATLDAVYDAGPSQIARPERLRVAKWIASRQGLPGSYANMFAPTDRDRKGLRLYTGEKITTRAATAHILGEEACRALVLLNVSDAGVQRALAAAQAGIAERLEHAEKIGVQMGTYCCGPCTVSMWRHLLVGGLGRVEERLAAGLRQLKKHRLDSGRWRRFPFYYTLTALVEMEHSQDELRYVASACERALQRTGGKLEKRRRLLLEKVLAKV